MLAAGLGILLTPAAGGQSGAAAGARDGTAGAAVAQNGDHDGSHGLDQPEVAQDVTIDRRQVAFIVRALRHDARLRERAGADIHVGVLGKLGDGRSLRTAAAMTIAFRDLGDLRVQGLPLTTTQLTHAGIDELTALVKRRGVDVLYLCPGLEDELDAILAMTRRRHLLTVGGRLDHVERGASLGVFPLDGVATVVVNLAANRQEGVAFSADLLRVAKVVR